MKTAIHDRHIERTRLALGDGQWWTLKSLAEFISCSEAAASARLRDLRKARYGSHKILRRHVGPGGRHIYRMLVQKKGVAI